MAVEPIKSVFDQWDNPKATPPLPVIRFDQIEPCLDAADFVQGILTRQSAIVIYGESNSGKTFWTTDLALHIAAGLPWNGRRVEQGAVVYCVLEGGVGFKNRVAAWRRHHGLEDASIPFVAIPAGLNLLDPEADTPRLIETINAVAADLGVPVVLVVIDTLSRALAGGNENAPDDMGALVTNMDTIRSSTGAATAFVHHSGKDAARGARGHSLLRAAIDTEIEVTAPEDTDQRKVEIVKQRDLPKGGSFGFRLDLVELGRNRHSEPVTSCIPIHLDAAPTTRGRLKGDAAVAYDILNDAIAEHGQTHPDSPPGTPSVPVDWWRDRFYDRAKAGASQDTKQKAFRRAADTLIGMHRIATHAERVWVV